MEHGNAKEIQGYSRYYRKMKYDLSKSYDRKKALEYLKKLIEDGSKVSFTKIHPKRSVSQNSYLHVLFTLWGLEHGYFIEEAKQTVKFALGYYDHNDTGYYI